ncbi:MAG: Protease precursor [Labilithrix sp.]|nr:Protease precursor [Labilithrix sp.]
MSQKIAALTARVNEKAKADVERWTYEGSVPFVDLGAASLGGEVPHVHRFRLGNGLRVLVLVDKSAPVMSYFTWFRVGSRHEKPGKTGLAHLFEHLMFNESEGLKAGEFDRKLEENGAESNAATWLDWTYYYESLPKDRFALAVKLESNRMAKLVLREPQIVSEKEVVANERRMRVDDDVEGIANEVLYKTAFTKHPYHWPTIGWMVDIENFTPDDCVAFYKTYYAPNNATVVICGDVNEKDVLEKVRDAYASIPASIIPEEDTTPEPAQLENREVLLKKPTASEKILLGFHGPALGDADHAALSLLNEVLYGGRASRMYKQLVTTHEVCTELRGWVSTFRDPGLYEMYFTARPGVTRETVLGRVDEELRKVCEEPVTEEELVRAKARLELGLVQSLETASGKAEQIGFNDTVLGDPAAAFRRLEAYRRVSAGELRTAARRYLTLDARTIVHVIPDKSEGSGDAAIPAGQAAE